MAVALTSGGLPAGYARFSQIRAARRKLVLRQRHGLPSAGRGNDRPRDAARDDSVLHWPHRERRVPDRATDGAGSRAARPRPRSLRRLLLSLPRSDRRRAGNDRPAWLQAADVLPRSTAPRESRWLLLRCHVQRLWSDVELRVAGPGTRPLGYRRLHLRLAAQSEHSGRQTLGRRAATIGRFTSRATQKHTRGPKRNERFPTATRPLPRSSRRRTSNGCNVVGGSSVPSELLPALPDGP